MSGKVLTPQRTSPLRDLRIETSTPRHTTTVANAFPAPQQHRILIVPSSDVRGLCASQAARPRYAPSPAVPPVQRSRATAPGSEDGRVVPPVEEGCSCLLPPYPPPPRRYGSRLQSRCFRLPTPLRLKGCRHLPPPD